MIPPDARIVVKAFWVFFLFICVVVRYHVQGRLHPTRARIIGDIFIGVAWLLLALGSAAFINEDVQFLRWYRIRPKPFNNTMVDMERLDMPFLHASIRATYVGMVFVYYTVLWCVKGAFLALYFDIFNRGGELQRRYKVALWGIIAWTFACYATLIIYHTMLCTPIQRNWDLKPKCSILRSNNSLDMSFSSNVLTDMPIMAFPLFVIHKLRMTRRQKLGFAFVFSMGLLTITIATVRFTQIQLFKRLNVVSNNHTEDYSNRNINLEMWSLAEMWTAIFAACLPAFRVFLRGSRSGGGSRRSPTPDERRAEAGERRWDSMGFEKGVLRTVSDEDEGLPEVVPGGAEGEFVLPWTLKGKKDLSYYSPSLSATWTEGFEHREKALPEVPKDMI